jgi:inner membrane protein
VAQVARESLREQGIAADRLLVTPAPFNTVLWRVVAMGPEQYAEGHYSLLDESTHIDWRRYDRGAALAERHATVEGLRRMAAFTHGFFRVQEDEGRLYVTDLRMGQEPSYTFHFDLGTAAERANGPRPSRMEGMRVDVEQGLGWLWRRLRGERLLPPGLVAPAPR